MERRRPRRRPELRPFVAQPELARLLPVLYPGVFPNLAALTADRADLLAILLTGIPAGLIDGFQNFTGPTQADVLRLNLAIPPTHEPNRLGLLGGDLAGFPNGRRLADDVVTIELRAVAGATYPLIDPGSRRTPPSGRSRTARSNARPGVPRPSSPTSACPTAATTSPAAVTTPAPVAS